MEQTRWGETEEEEAGSDVMRETTTAHESGEKSGAHLGRDAESGLRTGEVSGQGHRKMRSQGRGGHKAFKGTTEKSEVSQRYEGIQKDWVRSEPAMAGEGQAGGGARRPPAGYGTRPRELRTGAGRGRAGHRSGETEGWHVRVCVVGRWKLVCVTGARRGCENSLFHGSRWGEGSAARAEDGASRRVETGRLPGTL